MWTVWQKIGAELVTKLLLAGPKQPLGTLRTKRLGLILTAEQGLSIQLHNFPPLWTHSCNHEIGSPIDPIFSTESAA